MYILALDQGTTSSRAIVFDRSGRVISLSQREYRQIYPQSGWVEHDPKEILDSQTATAREALAKASLSAADIAAVGVTNQRETAVVWDRKTGEPIYNAIVWQDRRTAAFCSELRERYGELIREKSGLEVDAYFSASKVRWILDNVEDARRRAEAGELAFGTVDSWLVWNLTGGRCHVTDVSNASRTMLFDIDSFHWNDRLLEIFDIPKCLLPEVRASSEIYGTIESPAELRGIAIGGIAGDQQAALFGQACFWAGATKNTYGTGCFMLQNVGGRRAVSANRLLSTIGWQIGDEIEYALEGSVFIGGAVIQWLRDSLGIIERSSDVEELAASVPDSDGVYFVPAFVGLGSPHWDQEARGTIVGLTRGSGRAHIARAALESIAFQTADLLDAMTADSGVELSELRVDGGAVRNDLLMQFQADLLQIPIIRPKISETTALGAAYLAGLAAGFWSSKEELAEHWEAETIFEPRMESTAARTLRERWNAALKRSLAWER